MKWVVAGASATNGEDCREVIEAEDRSAAEKAARAKGIMVEKIDRVDGAGAAPVLNYGAKPSVAGAAKRGLMSMLNPAAGMSPADRALRKKGMRFNTIVATCNKLRSQSRAICVLGWLTAAIGALTCFAGVIAIIDHSNFTILPGGVLLIVAGSCIRGFGLLLRLFAEWRWYRD